MHEVLKGILILMEQADSLLLLLLVLNYIQIHRRASPLLL